MSKGKFGLSLAAVAVIAFGFSALRQPQSVLLVAGFALLAEKDEWLNKQAMQALLLTIVYYVAELVNDWIFGGLARFFEWVELYDAKNVMSTAGSFVEDVLYLALIVFSALAVLRVLRGKDAKLPFLSKMVDGDIAALKSKTRAAETSAQTAPPTAGCADSNAIRTSGATYGFAPDSSHHYSGCVCAAGSRVVVVPRLLSPIA